MFQRILVPLDGSTASFNAFDWAIQIALGEQSVITALCVIDARVSHEARLYLPMQDQISVSAETPSASKLSSTYQEWAEQLSRQAQGRGAAVNVEVRPQIITGIPYQEIISHSSTYDLLVMGAWNTSAAYAGPFLAGKTLRQVVTHTHLPTLCVAGHLQKLETMLVAYDDSREAQDALQLAASWSQASGLTLIVLTVQPDGQRAQELLQEARRRAMPVVPKLVAREGHPIDAILEVANEYQCNLITLGVHPVHSLLGQTLGPVTDALLHTHNLPLLLSH
jgi:nucleotide-binding universal stress UspA family protein